MKIGYVRVSSASQNTERQEVMMEKLGVDKIFIDVCSGKNANRPQLMAMLDYVREGDTIIVESISRLARNAKDLLNITDQLIEKGVDFISQKETIDTNTPAGKAMLTIFGAISQLERDYIRERQREGVYLAKERGVYKGKTPIAVDKDQFEKEYKLWKDGHITARLAMQHLGLKPNTFYRRVKAYEDLQKKNAENKETEANE